MDQPLLAYVAAAFGILIPSVSLHYNSFSHDEHPFHPCSSSYELVSPRRCVAVMTKTISGSREPTMDSLYLTTTRRLQRQF